MPTIYSSELARLVDEAVRRAGLTNGQASIRTNGEVSEGYFSRIRTTGYVPSKGKLRAISAAFPELGFRELVKAATGEDLPADGTELPAGARLLALDSEGMPLGVPLPAGTWGAQGEPYDERFSAERHAQGAGAVFAYEVAGDCLSPQIARGDYVYVRPAQWADPEDVVLVRTGDAYTLKIWRPKNGVPYLATADEDRFPGFQPDGSARIIGVVTGIYKPNPPRFR